MPDAAVELEDVYKTYRMHERPLDRLLEQLGLGRLARSPAVEFDALRGVSLRVPRGERLGIVGRNGAGKTTLLKLITGNFAPTRGRVTTRGSVQALMQVGLGFHASFTGYENARSALLYNGLSGRALEDAVDDVIQFCELGEFLHQPIGTYSLGMRMRLQFATATAIRPEILVVDEIMGAGDAYFSAKSADRMKRLTGDGCTLVLVSHSPYQVLEFCDHALWLDEGSVRMAGDAHDVLGAYEVFIEQLAAGAVTGAPSTDRRHGHELTTELEDGRKVFRWPGKTGVKVVSLRFTDSKDETSTLREGGPSSLEIGLLAEETGRYACTYMVTFWSNRMRRVARVESEVDRFDAQKGARRSVHVDLTPLLLKGGRYYGSISIYDKSMDQTSGTETRFDVLARCFSVDVKGEAAPPYYVHPSSWSFTP